MSWVLLFLASYSLTKTSRAAAAQPNYQGDSQGPGASLKEPVCTCQGSETQEEAHGEPWNLAELRRLSFTGKT